MRAHLSCDTGGSQQDARRTGVQEGASGLLAQLARRGLSGLSRRTLRDTKLRWPSSDAQLWRPGPARARGWRSGGNLQTGHKTAPQHGGKGGLEPLRASSPPREPRGARRPATSGSVGPQRYAGLHAGVHLAWRQASTRGGLRPGLGARARPGAALGWRAPRRTARRGVGEGGSAAGLQAGRRRAITADTGGMTPGASPAVERGRGSNLRNGAAPAVAAHNPPPDWPWPPTSPPPERELVAGRPFQPLGNNSSSRTGVE